MVAIMQENIVVGHQHILVPCNKLQIMSTPLFKRVWAAVVNAVLASIDDSGAENTICYNNDNMTDSIQNFSLQSIFHLYSVCLHGSRQRRRFKT